MSDTLPYPELNERQRQVFTALLQEYVTTARPVGSRTLSRRLPLELSPATVRNVMADLEDLGLLTSPHTSAGRIPTTLAYGLYVDSLMQRVDLPPQDRESFARSLEEVAVAGIGELLDRAGEALAQSSTLISVVLSPQLVEGVLHRIDLVRIATGRLLVILSIRSGFVRSILLEIESQIPDGEVDAAARMLNERLSGLRLADVRDTIQERFRDSSNRNAPVIRRVIESADHIFRNDRVGEIHVDGTARMLEQPEFADLERSRAIIEILEDRDVILHVLGQGRHQPHEGVRIAIGEETGETLLRDCSVITATYNVGGSRGSLGIIGPTRMDYARLASLAEYAARAIHNRLVS